MEDEKPEKCSWGDGISIRPDGEHELDPCIYQDVQILKNVTVVISRCIRCGHMSFGWMEQDNTELVLDLLSEEGESDGEAEEEDLKNNEE